MTTLSHRFRKPLLIVVTAVLLLAGVGWWVVLPQIVRSRAQRMLETAGFTNVHFGVRHATLWGVELTSLSAGGRLDLRAQSIALTYSPSSLWHGRIHSIAISGLELPLTGIAAARVAMAAPSPTSVSRDLPFDQLKLIDSNLITRTAHEQLKLPISASAVRQPTGKFHVTAAITLSNPLGLEGTVDPAAANADLVLGGKDVSGQAVSAILAAFAPQLQLSTAGNLDTNGRLQWADGAGSLDLTITASAPAQTTAEPAPGQLLLRSGVFHVVGQMARDTQPLLRVTVQDASLARGNVAAEAISGTFVFPGDQPQRFTARTLRIGAVTLTDGAAAVRLSEPKMIVVEDAQWHWLDGLIGSDDVRINTADNSVAATVHAKDLDLGQLLGLFAQGRAAGQGKLSGQLALKIDDGRITFGEGAVTALHPGELQVKDTKALSESLGTGPSTGPGTAGGGPGEQMRANIIDALKDFEYDTLKAEIVRTPAGLGANVRMIGRGRTGARQALDYELHVRGLDELLRIVLNLQSRYSAARDAAKAEK